MAKILVADDNSNIQKMVGLALKDQGIDVVAVGNGEAAVRKISDIRPDLVLADVFMPVRNGYEVCRYVKEDSTLKHIPVILLVGAFDPLDEQEAQRVGADGVLKKPFVPPDPLISMVKSALVRAGVPLGSAPAAEKAPPSSKRSPADIFNPGVSSRIAAPAPEKLPEASPVPMEEFPTLPAQLKIAEGKQPLAFGSLLEAPDEGADQQLTSKPMIQLAEACNWEEEPDEVEEEKEEVEESPQGGWRPAGLDEEQEHAAASSKETPDWREEAFHGASPAKSSLSNSWAPSLDEPELVGASDAKSVAVTTVATKPVDAPAPFTGDAWAAAMAAGVEEKLAEIKEIATVIPEAQFSAPATEDSLQQLPTTAAASFDATAVEAAPADDETKSTEPVNWAAIPETAWEMEAKKASLLASTWDAPKVPSVDDTQDVPVYVAEESVAPTEGHQETPPESSPYSGELEASAESAANLETPANEAPSEPAVEASEPKSWENTSEAPAGVSAESVVQEARTEESPVEEAHPSEQEMDEIVARVLGKMNPEVLERVTREILMPVIEAIVRDEINAKKS